ncbi:MAG: pantoate--beta-alanine ligase [Gemmatimonadetes bacterium]|nr:pantoate--beta-alanine ligase [Gemmatimonadota bacterium]
MKTVTTIGQLREHIGRARAAGRRVGLVPTMGALHEGHLQLCDAARRHADEVVLSIFVNPLQFGPAEDFDRYPRDLNRDAGLVSSRGVALLFAPETDEVFPNGSSPVRVHAPDLGNVLCGRFRPGHFEGVLTIVAKLFNMVRPDCAVFGQKDLQQASLIRRMARDLDFGIDVIVGRIVRDPDGIALSSRNAYLSADQRHSALALHRALSAAQAAFAAGADDPAVILGAARATLEAEPGVATQYVEVVDPESLATPDRVGRGHAVAVAAYVGSTRLIDNHILEQAGSVP